jgi:transcriptional regulator with XRE-family HTH domain
VDEVEQSLEHRGDLELTIGAVVRAWREFRGWSLTEFAQRAGLKKGHVSEIEQAKIDRPSRATLQKLATGLGIDEWDLHTRRMPDAPSDDERSAPRFTQAPIGPPSGSGGGFAFAAHLRPGDGQQRIRRISRLVDELRAELDILLAEGHDDDGRAG